MAQANLNIGDMAVDQVYSEAITKGLSEVDAAILVGNWILERFGRSKRIFNYNQQMERQEPGCQPQFSRSFLHTDWIDGESVVQAELTAGEEGFNLRFHRIEDDFDSLKADVQKAFECLANLRKEAKARFEEVRTELNRINSDVHECCHKDQPGFGFGAGSMVPGGLIDTGRFIGTMMFNDRHVSMWQTAQGYMMLPNIYTAGTDFIRDQRVQKAGYVAKYLTENNDVQALFANNQPVPKKVILEKFGDAILSNGKTLRSNLEILPEASRYNSADALINDVAEREAAALRSRAGTERAVKEVFGLDAEFENLKEAPVERFGGIPENARSLFARKGIETMDKLAQGNTRQLLRLLRSNGIEATAGDVAEWQATAKTLVLIKK